MPDPSVITSRLGRIGRVLLNRPKALNALDIDMIRAMRSALDNWRDDPCVHAVVVEGSGGKAFCAGGDVRTIRDNAISGNTTAVEGFFSQEYALNAAIAEYPKPYISLIDGISMGGGIGISVHGRIAVTSESGLFAMPETGIGLFPDVGGSHALPRMPGAIGMYLALTGAHLTGADAVHAGLATHFVRGACIDALRETLARDGATAVPAFAEALPPFSLAGHREAIDRCFGAASVPDIMRALEAEGTDWARDALMRMAAASPSSLFWTFEILRRGARSSLRAALFRELKLTRKVAYHHDFHEGVRAAIVDKDRSPRWSPPRIEDVDPGAITAMFE